VCLDDADLVVVFVDQADRTDADAFVGAQPLRVVLGAGCLSSSGDGWSSLQVKQSRPLAATRGKRRHTKIMLVEDDRVDHDDIRMIDREVRIARSLNCSVTGTLPIQ